MNRRLLVFCTALLFALPALSCGPDWPEVTFVKRFGPDEPYKAYARGRIGVPQPEYRTRSLVLAFRYFSGQPLTPAQQQQAVAVDNFFLNAPANTPGAATGGVAAWAAAHQAFDAVSPFPKDNPPDLSRAVPGDQYNNFTNCLDDAFANAARTLSARIKSHGAKDPAVTEWVRGQDIVFSNCTTGSNVPAPVASPAWLQQDRAYQIAAARFYSLQYDAALDGFRAIAADTSSPWSTLSRYIVARVLLRKAALSFNRYGEDAANKGDAAQSRALAGYAEARKDLVALRAEPRMAPMRSAIDDLLDLVNARLQPDRQSVLLASRLVRPDTRFDHDLVDLTLIRYNGDLAMFPARTPDQMRSAHSAALAASPAAEHDGAELVAWLDAVSGANAAINLTQWRAHHTTPWLVSALMFAQPGNAANSDLLHAAEAVSATDPAYLAVTYHRLRLSNDVTLRGALPALMPRIEKVEGASTINLFAQLRARSAPTLDAWLADAGRVPAGVGFNSQEDDALDTKPAEQPCGPPVAEADLRLFTPEAAAVLNTRLPLSQLALAAESSVLPPNLRFAVAQSVWTRSVLSDEPAIALRMSPVLIHCRPAWKAVLDPYDTARTGPDRKAYGLLALMRFASTEPNVRAGEPRAEGFATYSEYRDNWWCSLKPQPSDLRDVEAPLLSPAFLTASEAASGQHEAERLQALPSAADYFAGEALAWVASHPHDARNADLLGEALRVERNSCGDDATKPLAKRLFETLQRTYPQSTWARKYTTYE